MPPKKKGKAKAPPKPKLNHALTNRPPTLDTSQQHMLNTFLPYLAMGFSSADTPASGFLCGIHALCISYNAANKALLGRKNNIPELHFDTWINWFRTSPAYHENVVAYIKGRPAFYPDDKHKARALKEMKEVNWLDFTQLVCLLDVANTRYKTKYQLGLLSEGFWGQWDNEEEYYDYDYLYQDQPQVSEGVGNRPILWIFNNNASVRANSHSTTRKVKKPEKGKGSSEGVGDHWEGFAILDPDAEDYNNYLDRRAQIEEFGVGGRIDADIKAGVYILTSKRYSNDDEDQKPMEQSDDEGEEEKDDDKRLADGILSAYRGSFLRISEPLPGIKVPDGYWYMSDCNGIQGFVREGDFTLIEAHGTAPDASTDEHWADISAQIKAKNKDQFTKSKVGRNALGGGKTLGDWNPDDDNLIPLRFFRIIAATDKIGNLAADGDPINTPIDGFQCHLGEFMLDSRERIEKPGTSAAHVTRADGAEGEVWIRKLQLWEKPFGLKDQLPVRKSPGIDIKQNTAKEISQFAKSYNIATKGHKKADLFKLVIDFENENTGYLTLWRITRNLDAAEIGSDVAFLEGEYVLERPDATAGKYRHRVVRDFEGYEAEISEKRLERVSEEAWDMRLLLSGKDAPGIFLPARADDAAKPAPPPKIPPKSPPKSPGKGKKKANSPPSKKSLKHAPVDDSEDELSKPVKKAKKMK